MFTWRNLVSLSPLDLRLSAVKKEWRGRWGFSRPQTSSGTQGKPCFGTITPQAEVRLFDLRSICYFYFPLAKSPRWPRSRRPTRKEKALGVLAGKCQEQASRFSCFVSLPGEEKLLISICQNLHPLCAYLCLRLRFRTDPGPLAKSPRWPRSRRPMRKEKALGVLARKCQEQASRSEGSRGFLALFHFLGKKNC
jgi:hypothetical protein